ncbi:MAG TPA: DUF374 domain-containing protein [Candidatus Latescibacteria bacterium]|nr:DUF374 domain-containing protein [Candidatus Latescibacterota bacterium]
MKNRTLLWLESNLTWLILLAIGKSLRIKVVGASFHHLLAENGGLIYALWHGRMFVPIYSMRNRGITVLASEHRDGELISRVLERLGYNVVRGSTTSGGKKALKKMLTMAKGKKTFAFTPDGPRGPRAKVQPGVVFLAQHTGLPILPIAGAAKKARIFKSWDRFLLPMPFSKCSVVFGKPFWVRKGEDLKKSCQKLEEKLNHTTMRADTICKANRS